MLFEPLFIHARNQPNEPAVTDEQGAHTYAQLAGMCAGLGAYIPMRTSLPNVGLLLPAGAAFMASFYGTLLAGKSAVLLNYLLGEKEIAHIIRDSGIDTVLTIPQLAGRVQGSSLNVVDLTQLPRPEPLSSPPAIRTPDPDSMAALIYTSGTSGLPKGVVLTYANLQSCVDAAIAHAQLRGRHRFAGVVPPFHSLGLTATVIAPVQLGASVYTLARFSAVALMNMIRQHSISLLFMVPSMYAALLHLKNASRDDFKLMYAAISGGEPLPETVRTKFEERFGLPLLEGYGLTETCGAITINVPHARRAGSVGQFIPGGGARFIDDDGKMLGAGETGEILLHGPMVMKGYYHLPDETAAALTQDHYFRTGDLGHLDSDGFLFITGRKKEMISIAGEKASPREIEDTLLRHPDVADVAVVGKKDSTRGEIVVGFVVARQGESIKADALRDFCRDQGLAQWKIPREIHFLEDLPRSPTGKVLKRVLVETLKDIKE
jgi:long-chain acyl-CoA synthetase